MSVAIFASTPGELARPLAEAAQKIDRPTGGVVFVSGELAAALDTVAATVARAWPGVPTLIVAGEGVMTERGTCEGSAAAALLLRGNRIATFCLPPSKATTSANALAQAVGRSSNEKARAGLVFFDPSAWYPDTLRVFEASSIGCPIFGGGTTSEPGVAVIDADGGTQLAAAGGLLFFDAAPPLVALAPAVRLLGPPSTITEVRSGLVTRLDGEPALDVLTRLATPHAERPLVLAFHHVPDDDSALLRGRVLPIRGLDPARKAMLVGPDVRQGERLTFATPDPSAARANLEASLRDVARRAAGAAGRFGVYVNCAGHGPASQSEVDAKALHAQFAGMPIAGITPSFGLAPGPRGALSHTYTSVFTLFTSPS